MIAVTSELLDTAKLSYRRSASTGLMHLSQSIDFAGVRYKLVAYSWYNCLIEFCIDRWLPLRRENVCTRSQKIAINTKAHLQIISIGHGRRIF